MKKTLNFIQNNGEYIIIFLSNILLLLGLFYCVWIIYQDIFNNKCITDSNVKLIGILIIGGLLGGVLNSVLKKYLKDFVKENINEEYLRKYINEEVSDYVPDFITETNLANNDEKEQNNLKIIDIKTVLDTIIVPVKYSYDDIIKNELYVCPKKRKFNNNYLGYIAFYKDRKVIGYGKIKNKIADNGHGEQVFELTEITKLNISMPKGSKGAFIQNRLYCNIEKLKNATNTNDIRPDLSDK